MGFINDCLSKLGVEAGFFEGKKNKRDCIPAYRIISENRTVGILGEVTKDKRTAFYIAAAEGIQFLYGHGIIDKVGYDNYYNLIKEFYNTNRTYA